jgi:hypothetical protein
MSRHIEEERKRVIRISKLELVRALLATGVADNAKIHVSESHSERLGEDVIIVVLEKVV